MKSGRTLQDLAIELDRQVQAKRDFVVNTTAMMMEDDAKVFSITKPPESGIHNVDAFSMTGLFHRQLGASLEIPEKYYDKMRIESPALLAWNVDWWLKQYDTTHMIRTLDGTARAFLSNRYRRIDNYEIAQSVLPVFAEMPDARVESCEVTENRMYIKVVNRRLEAQVTPGDIVQAGVVVSNSEVGLGSVSVVPLVYRLVCSNGMIVNDLSERKHHIGRANNEAWELFSDTTLKADDNAFMLKLADIVRAAVDGARFAMVVDKLRKATEAPLTGQIASVVELTAKQYRFTQPEQNSIMQHLITGGDLSLYGLSNAVTLASQNVNNYDRATALESAGWKIATMPRSAWATLNGS